MSTSASNGTSAKALCKQLIVQGSSERLGSLSYTKAERDPYFSLVLQKGCYTALAWALKNSVTRFVRHKNTQVWETLGLKVPSL